MRPYIFDIAKQVSLLSLHPKYPMGAVVAKRNKVLGIGFNKAQTHPRSFHPFRMVHAELAAILNAKTDVKDCEVYVFRQTKDGKTAQAKPCPSCQAMLYSLGVRTVYYSTPNGVEQLDLGE